MNDIKLMALLEQYLTTTAVAESSWWVRNEFLLRRLHSLSGLVPVGAFMVVHLTVNASLLNENSAATFQANVLRIHGLGRLLWVVEWMFIFSRKQLFHKQQESTQIETFLNILKEEKDRL